jgi:hypothetical protein
MMPGYQNLTNIELDDGVAKVELLEGITHMGVVVIPAVHPVVREWLKSLDKR